MNNICNTHYSGRIIWLYGRPCTGKSTIANSLAARLNDKGISAITIDGDELRETINSDLGFCPEHRYENIRRAAELAKIMANKGFNVICSFITPTKELRELIKQINHNIELHIIYINTSVEECIRRDVKGHYLKAKNGTLPEFTGIGSPFIEPDSHEVAIVNTDGQLVKDTVDMCLRVLNLKV